MIRNWLHPTLTQRKKPALGTNFAAPTVPLYFGFILIENAVDNIHDHLQAHGAYKRTAISLEKHTFGWLAQVYFQGDAARHETFRN